MKKAVKEPQGKGKGAAAARPRPIAWSVDRAETLRKGQRFARGACNCDCVCK